MTTRWTALKNSALALSVIVHAVAYSGQARSQETTQLSNPADGASSGSLQWNNDSSLSISSVPELEVGCEDCDEGALLAGQTTPMLGGDLVRAWLGQGFTWNPSDPVDDFNTPVTFNDFANDYQMNQLYLSVGRDAATCGPTWDLGGRIDLLYGTDYFFTTSEGLETEQDGTQRWNSDNGPRAFGAARYGLAMPQLYADVFAPIGCGINIKLGHFYTILGYESVMAPENFFYSHAYAMQYGEPFTHTGMLATFHLPSGATVDAGFTRGWDNWEDANDQLAFLGGFSWTSLDGRTDFSIALHSGNEDDAGDNTRTSYSFVMAHRISGCLTYVLQHDLGVEQNGALEGNALVDATWYGINQYLLVTLSQSAKFGLRAEWFRDQDNARVLAIPTDTVDGGNYFALTAGFNIDVASFMVLRPELRWDWSDVESTTFGIGGPFDTFTDQDQFTLATDLIIRF